MNLHLNEAWLTDNTPAGGGRSPATPAELPLKPDNATAGSAAAGGDHNRLELTLGMPSSYPSSPRHLNNGEPRGRATTAHSCCAAAASLFSAHGASDKPPTGTHAAPPCYTALGAKRWFSETAAAPAAGVGFVHPWSLAARQGKAAMEQAVRAMVAGSNQPAAASSTLLAAVSRPTDPAPPAVGWPPIRTYRKNVIANPPRMQKPVTEDDDEKEAKKSKACDKEERQANEEPTRPSTMFVKVNMEGFAVGRKIDLLAHDGYDSLSRALHKMFDNFLSVKNAKMASEKDGQNGTTTPELVLLYEDNEGDRMLVGDVPWEMFVGSVKRLYISITPKLHGSVADEQEKSKKESETVLT